MSVSKERENSPGRLISSKSKQSKCRGITIFVLAYKFIYRVYRALIFTLRRTPLLWTCHCIVRPQCLLSESWRPTYLNFTCFMSLNAFHLQFTCYIVFNICKHGQARMNARLYTCTNIHVYNYMIYLKTYCSNIKPINQAPGEKLCVFLFIRGLIILTNCVIITFYQIILIN